MQVEFDPNKAAANRKKHGVSLDEAAGSLLDPLALVREDEDAEGEVPARRHEGRNDSMRKEYDFTGAKRAKDVPHLAKLQAEVVRGKTRITILLDADVVTEFRARAEREGKGYQTLINAALRAAVAPESAPVTVEALRQVLREELRTR